jgi:hypothetical protein
MKKSINLMLIGVLLVASLLLALPFTPLRKSFNGITSKYIDNAVTKMGVDFSEQLKNARTITKSRSYPVSGLEVGNGLASKASTNSNADFSGMNSAANSGNYSIVANDNKNSNNSGIAGGIGGFSANMNNKNKKTNGVKAISFGSPSGDLSLNGTTTSPKSAGAYAEGEGGTHPGLDPNNPPPSLPIGEGANILLVLAALFGIWKIKNSIRI